MWLNSCMAKMLDWNARTYIMGILNLTPDSFSGDGLMSGDNYIKKAVEQAGQFLDDGADILDIGAESTRPGSQPVSVEEELQRLMPALVAIRKNHPDILISIDTYKSQVAKEVLQAGADWINDIWGLHADIGLAEVVARFQAGLVLMHNSSQNAKVELTDGLGGRYVQTSSEDVISDIKMGLLESISLAFQAGIKKKCIILDPGIGFGKNVSQNLEIIRRLREVKALGYPLLVGPSRKSFIGYTLNLPPDQRLEGTAAAVALSIASGADIVRVHDVRAMHRVARMSDAILRSPSQGHLKV